MAAAWRGAASVDPVLNPDEWMAAAWRGGAASVDPAVLNPELNLAKLEFRFFKNFIEAKDHIEHHTQHKAKNMNNDKI